MERLKFRQLCDVAGLHERQECATDIAASAWIDASKDCSVDDAATRLYLNSLFERVTSAASCDQSAEDRQNFDIADLQPADLTEEEAIAIALATSERESTCANANEDSSVVEALLAQGTAVSYRGQYGTISRVDHGTESYEVHMGGEWYKSVLFESSELRAVTQAVEEEVIVTVVRDGTGSCGFTFSDDMAILTIGTDGLAHLSLLRLGDTIVAVNGVRIKDKAEYYQEAQGITEFDLTLHRAIEQSGRSNASDPEHAQSSETLPRGLSDRIYGAMSSGVTKLEHGMTAFVDKWEAIDHGTEAYAKKFEAYAKDKASTVADKSRAARQVVAEKYMPTKAKSMAEKASLVRAQTEEFGKARAQSMKNGLQTAKGKVLSVLGRKQDAQDANCGGA
jgi:hypothetical protein